jgi:hypothetical protein
MVKVQGYKIDNLSMQLHKLSEQIAILTSLKASQINHPFIPAPVIVPVEPVLKNVTIGPCVSAIDMVEEEVVAALEPQVAHHLEIQVVQVALE